MDYDFVFKSVGRLEWIKTIVESINGLKDVAISGDRIFLHLPSETDKFEAVHLASLACLIEFFHKKGCK